MDSHLRGNDAQILSQFFAVVAKGVGQFAMSCQFTMITTLMGIARRDAAGDNALTPDRTHLPTPALTQRVSPRIVPASQGGVQFPTGGVPFLAGSPRALPGVRKVSRSGEKPEPTVTVRMKEKTAAVHGRERFFAAP